MSCYTMAKVDLSDDRYTKEAVKKLGVKLDANGQVSKRDATRVKKEASTLKAIAMVRLKNPRAVIRRKGNKLTVTVEA